MAFSSLSKLSEWFYIPDTIRHDVIFSGAVAMVLALGVLVPAIALLTSVPLLPLVALVLISYAMIFVYSDLVFEGLVGAVCVLFTFAADIPVLRVHPGANVELFLFDFALIYLLGLTTLHARRDGWQLPRQVSIPFVALLAFVFWSGLAAIFGAGPSTRAGIVFVIEHLRYPMVFITGALVVRHVHPRVVVTVLAIATTIQTGVALLQSALGHSLGLPRLGDYPGTEQFFVEVGSLRFAVGLFPGGFASTSRTLVALVLIVLPSLLFISASERFSGRTIVGIAGSFVGALMIRISDSDAAVGAAVSIAAMVFILPLVTDRRQKTRTRLIQSGTAMLFAVFVLLFRLQPTQRIPTGSGTNQSANTTSGGAGQSAGTTGGESRQLGVTEGSSTSPLFETVISIVEQLPLLSANTVAVRLIQYTAALDVGMKYPLFGLGGWNFYLVATDYGLAKQFYIHNTYLEYLAGTGIPGALLYSAAVGCSIWGGIQVARKIKDKRVQISLVVGLIGVHLFAAFVVLHNMPIVYGTVWFLSGVVTNAAANNR